MMEGGVINTNFSCQLTSCCRNYQHRKRRRHCSPFTHHKRQPAATVAQPWSFLLTLLLLFNSNNSNNSNSWTASFGFGGVQLISAKTTIQGFIYWDENSNGILDDTNNNNYSAANSNANNNAAANELLNGIIDTQIQLRHCSDFTSFSTTGDGQSIASTISSWHPYNMGGKFEGHNEIYPGGGYWRLDLEDDYTAGSGGNGAGGGAGKGCLLTDEDLITIQKSNQGGAALAASARVGCYLVISSPENYQITSSFPLRHLNYHERRFAAPLDSGAAGNVVGGNSNEGGATVETTKASASSNQVVFDWIPHHDVAAETTSSSTTTSQSSSINHGYHARTLQCFGYHPTKRMWYSYTPTTSSSSGASASSTSAVITPIATPNEQQYNYDTLIYGPSGNPNEIDVYDTTLSMTPIGMSESGWPLDLRVSTDVVTATSSSGDDVNNSNVGGGSEGGGGGSRNDGGLIMGLKLDHDRTNGEYVLLSDSGTLSEGKGGGGGGAGGGEARFEFVSKVEEKGGSSSSNFVSALQFFKEKKELEDAGGSGGGGNNDGMIAVSLDESSSSSNNSPTTEYEHDNINGILENPQTMIEVIQSFLLERGNLKTLEGGQLELTGLTVVLLNQWSLVTVVDKAQKEKEGGTSSATTTRDLVVLTTGDEEGMLLGEGEVRERKKSLRGSLSSKRGSNKSHHASNNNRLLRGGGSHQQHSPSSHRSMVAIPEPHLVFEFAVYAKYREKDGPKNQDAVALQVSSNFGNIVTNTCNIKRETLIARIRGRSGYFQGCNPKAQSNNDNGDGSVTYTAFGGEEKDYVEINIGVVNRFDCDKLLPLYYYELESLAVRPIIDDSGASLGGEGEVLSNALKLLQVDDGYYAVKDASTSSGTPTTTIAVAVSVVVGILFVAAVAAVWYVRRERRKLREERERRRKARESKLAAREARRQRKQDRSIKRSIKKEARGKKERVAPVTLDEEEYIPVKVSGDAGSLDDDLGGGGDEKPTEEEGAKHGPDDDDDSDADSELGRLFDKSEPDLHSREEEDSRPVRKSRRRRKKEDGGSETDSTSMERLFEKSERSNMDLHDQSNTSLQRRNNRRRRRKADGESETDSKTTDHSASNLSGMNFTATSKDEHQSMDKTPATRSQSSHLESDPVSGKSEADDDSEPPTRIELSERGTLQKGISDISLGLAASFKKSFTRAAATLKDLQEDGSDSEKEDHPKQEKVVRRVSKNESAEASRKDNKEEGTPTRRRRRTMTKMVSSFRKSSTETKVEDDGMKTGRRRRSRPAISKVMSSFRKSANDEEEDAKSPGRSGRRVLSSVGMSVRNLVIGELSSSSDDDSSSDSGSSSDSDSSSSSSDSSGDVRFLKVVVSRRASTENKSRSRKDKTSNTDTNGQRKPSKQGHIHKRASEESEAMSKTNEYLPRKLDANFDDGSCVAVAMPESPLEKFSRGDDSTCAAVATMKPPSERSLGSRTKSSKSNSDSHRADSHRADSKKVSKRSGKDDRGGSHGNRERKKKDKSSRHSSPKKSPKKKGEEDKDNTDGRTLERRSSRKVLDNVRSSLKRSLSGSVKGLSQPAKSALESEDARDTKDDSKRTATHSSRRKSTRKHHHREDSERGSDRNNHRRHRDDSEKSSDRDKRHRLDDSERGSDRISERNAEKTSRKRHSHRKDSDNISDRETNRGSSHKGGTHKSSSHRTKTKSSSSKHTSHKKSSGDGERARRRREAEHAN